MGLVTCQKCNRIYDYDKYNGICPKCARYNRESTSAQEHQEYHNKYDGGYNHSAKDDHHSFHQKYDTNPNPHTGNKRAQLKTKVVLGFFAFLFIICLISTRGILFIPVLLFILSLVLKKKGK